MKNCKIKKKDTTVNSSYNEPGYNEFRIIRTFLAAPSKRNHCLFITIYFGYNELRLYRTDFAGPLGVRYNRSRLYFESTGRVIKVIFGE